jgi:hypothetical protein
MIRKYFMLSLMLAAMPPLPQYAFMAWYSVKEKYRGLTFTFTLFLYGKSFAPTRYCVACQCRQNCYVLKDYLIGV